MRIISFSINNSLVVNLFLLIVVVAGVVSWKTMPQEMFPVVNLDQIRIQTEYLGAPPAEIERQITLPIEEQLDSLSDIDSIVSESAEGFSKVEIKLKPDTNVDDFLREVRSLMDALDDLPVESEKPQISRLKTRFPVISVALYGEGQLGELYAAAEQTRRKLLALPGVASVGIAGDREWEVWVIVDPAVLAASKVSLGEIRHAIVSNVDDLPGGSLQADEGDILLRGIGVSHDIDSMRDIVLRSESGRQMLLKEVADIQMRLEEPQTLGRFNGKPSVNLTVTKTPRASTIDVANAVREAVVEQQSKFGNAIQIGVFSDLSVYVKTRLDTVKSSGLVGLIFVLLSLYLALNSRVALITALGIPVSFLVAVVIIFYAGYTINMISLFAFLIALGMIVDDAIIVTENTYRHLEAGMDACSAAKRGAQEVFWPVTASTCTTVAAFLPMFGVSGTLGAFIEVIPVVVSAALIGSLVEAFIILPAHCADFLKLGVNKRKSLVPWRVLLMQYQKILSWSLLNRYAVSAVTIAVLMLVLTYAYTRMEYNQFGEVETGQFLVNIEAPSTYGIHDSEQLAKQIETRIRQSLQADELNTMLTNVGVILIDFNRLKTGSQFIQVIMDLSKPKPQGFIERYVSPLVNLQFSSSGSRIRTTAEIIDAIRKNLQDLPGIERFSILRPQGGPAGADIEIGLAGEDVGRLIGLSANVVEYLKRIPGVQDVRQDLEPGKLEYQYTLNERGRKLGLTQMQLAEAVRTGFVGSEISQVNWGQERFPVRLIYAEVYRADSAILERMPITLANGKTVYLNDVANISLQRGLGTILRRDGTRLSLVTAEVDEAEITPLEVSELVEKEFADQINQYVDYSLLFLGEKKEANDSFNDMWNVLVISLVLIFFILATLFKSLLDPFVIMLAIPFAIVGVIIGHVLFGYHLQFLSMIGFLALTGIVVNDSLILVDFANKARVVGMTASEAVLQAGLVRIRPILLTTVTTFLGISPLILFASGQTAFLSPMAVSLGFGLVFATALILLVVPCFYLIADDLRNIFLRKFFNRA